MLLKIAIIWILAQMNAPAWCIALVVIDIIVSTTFGILKRMEISEIVEKLNNFLSNH